MGSGQCSEGDRVEVEKGLGAMELDGTRLVSKNTDEALGIRDPGVCAVCCEL
jgi:hypothetical protein